MLRNTPAHPLAEVFGYPIDNCSTEAAKARRLRLCPFGNGVPECTKDKKDNPLGVCSVFNGGEVVITCPVRFRQNGIIVHDAARFFFPHSARWAGVGEVRLLDAHGKSAGNIDVVIASLDRQGRVADFGSLEVQAVYISGNVRDPFAAYMSNQSAGAHFVWSSDTYPRPDYLSSSRKRLAPQLQFKGGILHHWGKKMAVALDEHFFATLPHMPSVDAESAEMAWFIYTMERDLSANRYVLKPLRTVYTKFADSLAAILTSEPGPVGNFVSRLQRKLEKAQYVSPTPAPKR